MITEQEIISLITEHVLSKIPMNLKFREMGHKLVIESDEQKFTITVHEVKR